MKIIKAKHAASAGFTIIELLVATAVFSVVLVILVVAILNFYNGYYKTLISASTQNTVQNISDVLGQDIKLNAKAQTNSSNPLPGSGSNGNFCIGNTEFVYYLDTTSGQVPAGGPNPPVILYELPKPASCDPTPWSIAADKPYWSKGTSLLGDHYRLLDFTVLNVTGSLWSIDIKVAYTNGGSGGNGDDLLCSPTATSGNGSCSLNDSSTLPYSAATATTNNNVQCRIGVGSRFCYVAELQSVAENRL